MALFISPFAFRSSKNIVSKVSGNIKIFIIFGIFAALAQLAAYTAFSQAYVGYVSSILRLSSLFGVVLGGVFLKEERIRERFLGAIVMVAGALLIAL